MYVHNFFPVYKGEVAINDGVRGCTTKAKAIICREDNGDKRIIKTGMWQGKRIIREWKDTEKGKLVYWMKFGAFQRWNNKEYGRGIMRYHPDTLQRLHGLTQVFTSKFERRPGTCNTMYSWGKFLHQEFWYKLSKNRRRRAYSFHHNDKSVIFKYASGALAGEVSCPGGFKVFMEQAGDVCFHIAKDPADWEWAHNPGSPAAFDFSKDGNCQFVLYDRTGKIRQKGQYQNRQRIGEWVLDGRPVYFIRGVPVAKKLWDTPPEKIRIKTVLRLRNAQMRAALLSRIGFARITKECKHKVIHHTRTMTLMEFKIKIDEGRGRDNQSLRILKVTCPSTKTLYYLRVPDYIVTAGKRIALNTCEAARQWTMMNDDPKKRIKFARET